MLINGYYHIFYFIVLKYPIFLFDKITYFVGHSSSFINKIIWVYGKLFVNVEVLEFILLNTIKSSTSLDYLSKIIWSTRLVF